MSESTKPRDDEAGTNDALERARERLNGIWSAWGLGSSLDTGASTTQMNALGVAIEWLKRGEQDPARVVRAIQYLLCEPERPGSHQRKMWAPLKKSLLGVWGNAGTQGSDVRLMQALLFAAWGEMPVSGGFELAELVGSAWDAGRQRKEGEEKEIAALRGRTRARTALVRTESATIKDTSIKIPTRFDWKPTDPARAAVRETISSHISNWAPHLPSLIDAQKKAIEHVETDLREAAKLANAHLTSQAKQIADLTQSTARGPALLDLLWWGQSRYSRTLRRPYRRLDNSSDIPFWAAWEASDLAFQARVEVEPAAAYVVEVLDALRLDVDDKKPLREWMAELAASLGRAGDKAPPVGPALARLVEEDALGLPVTWVRLQTAARKSLENADDAVALDLGARLDRGQWTAWIFRESLLDRHLRGDAA